MTWLNFYAFWICICWSCSWACWWNRPKKNRVREIQLKINFRKVKFGIFLHRSGAFKQHLTLKVQTIILVLQIRARERGLGVCLLGQKVSLNIWVALNNFFVLYVESQIFGWKSLDFRAYRYCGVSKKIWSHFSSFGCFKLSQIPTCSKYFIYFAKYFIEENLAFY